MAVIWKISFDFFYSDEELDWEGFSVGDAIDNYVRENSSRQHQQEFNLDSVTQVVLPEHIRCASHTLNLLATVDADKVMSSIPGFKTAFDAVLDKVSAFWKQTNYSSQKADMVYSVLST